MSKHVSLSEVTTLTHVGWPLGKKGCDLTIKLPDLGSFSRFLMIVFPRGVNEMTLSQSEFQDMSILHYLISTRLISTQFQGKLYIS